MYEQPSVSSASSASSASLRLVSSDLTDGLITAAVTSARIAVWEPPVNAQSNLAGAGGQFRPPAIRNGLTEARIEVIEDGLGSGSTGSFREKLTNFKNAVI